MFCEFLRSVYNAFLQNWANHPHTNNSQIRLGRHFEADALLFPWNPRTSLALWKLLSYLMLPDVTWYILIPSGSVHQLQQHQLKGKIFCISLETSPSMPIPPMVGKNSTTCRSRRSRVSEVSKGHVELLPRCRDFGAQTFVDGTQFQSNHLSSASKLLKHKEKMMEMSCPLYVF